MVHSQDRSTYDAEDGVSIDTDGLRPNWSLTTARRVRESRLSKKVQVTRAIGAASHYLSRQNRATEVTEVERAPTAIESSTSLSLLPRYVMLRQVAPPEKQKPWAYLQSHRK